MSSMIQMIQQGAMSTVTAATDVMGGMQAKQAAVQQGRQDTEEASVANMKAGAEVSSDTENAAKTISRVEAGAGAAGVTAASATPILSEDYTQAKIKAAYARFNGNLAAAEDIYAAKYAKYQGNQAFWSGIFNAATTMAIGSSNVAKIGVEQRGWGSSSPSGAPVTPPPPGSS
jgi:hypothetical protein